uniref:Uncharacterized protein n=1 Tax=Ditylenchus dipsaci TaxID=166011 RepID=A0A915CYW0_9BILA
MSRSLQYKAKVSSIIHYDTLRSPQITRRVEYSDDEWQLEVSKKFSSTNFDMERIGSLHYNYLASIKCFLSMANRYHL